MFNRKRGEAYFDEKRLESARKFRGRLYIALSILVIALIIYFGYMLTYIPKNCEDMKCYEESLKNCRNAKFMRRDVSFNWGYRTVSKAEDDSCKVEVTLISINQGDSEFEKLIGKSMICKTYKSSATFPEKNIGDCSGPLREELQEIVIQRMHNYLLQNIGEIKKEFESFE